MSIAYERNTSLAFDTDVLKKAAGEYSDVADELRDMASKLDALFSKLESGGWDTPAGKAFYEMTKTNWKKNIEKYAALLDTLNKILVKASEDYDGLINEHVRTTKVSI